MGGIKKDEDSIYMNISYLNKEDGLIIIQDILNFVAMIFQFIMIHVFRDKMIKINNKVHDLQDSKEHKMTS